MLILTTAVGTAVTSIPARATAADAADALYVSLDYAVEGSAERCWDEPEFRRAVAQAVGYDPFRPGAALSVYVHVGASAALVDGRVEWRNAGGASMGERSFRAKDGDCASLLTEMSFAVGLQIELLRPRQHSTTPGDASPAPGTSTSPSAAPATPASPASRAAPSAPGTAPLGTPPSHRSPSSKTPDASTKERDFSVNADANVSSEAGHLWVGFGPSLAFGAAPSVTGHGRLFAGARQGALSLELGAEATLAVTEREADDSGFVQRLIGGSATACGHVSVMLGCVIGKAGQLRITGVGVDEALAPSALVAHAGVRLGAQWELSPVWFVTPHIDALALLTPRAVEVNDVTVWDMPPLSVLAGIDVGGRFR